MATKRTNTRPRWLARAGNLREILDDELFEARLYDRFEECPFDAGGVVDADGHADPCDSRAGPQVVADVRAAYFRARALQRVIDGCLLFMQDEGVAPGSSVVAAGLVTAIWERLTASDHASPAHRYAALLACAFEEACEGRLSTDEVRERLWADSDAIARVTDRTLSGAIEAWPRLRGRPKAREISRWQGLRLCLAEIGFDPPPTCAQLKDALKKRRAAEARDAARALSQSRHVDP